MGGGFEHRLAILEICVSPRVLQNDPLHAVHIRFPEDARVPALGRILGP
ncbi:hypothetical protein MAXJ12_25748 [Mesorhizobium alhagi CCNWXJ12-2]|uniref:Uncharacterized protein n=1 Tax=Mesorhizobium alhagi CCNWXJ12-2 TaxID=1107882 RepID=H0HY71_9HYPH|nr:hypothetical protein MAXJ12_25748 [Mesorhizobium alhagi CCNWXJ12-2]